MNDFLFFILVFVSAAIFITILSAVLRNKKFKELAGIERVAIGNYLAGHPSINSAMTDMSCIVTADDFVFINSTGQELGKIPRNSVNSILVEDKSKIEGRITATRLLAIGLFAFAVKKKKTFKEFCLLIDWDDDSDIKQNTIFEFSGNFASQLANTAANTLKKYINTKRISKTEKKCPYCAETIKAEAKVCRYCGKDLN